MPNAPLNVALLNRKQFNKAISEYSRKVTQEKIPMFVKGVALKILRGVILRTPVDTGFARNNWMVTIGSYGKDTPFEAEDNADGTIRREMQNIASKNSLGRIIYIWNAVPYIQYLETGTSDKAPEGMLRVTLAEIASELSSKYNFIGYYKANE